jgi:hypothetical protein
LINSVGKRTRGAKSSRAQAAQPQYQLFHGLWLSASATIDRWQQLL